jgi:hypothetical protein
VVDVPLVIWEPSLHDNKPSGSTKEPQKLIGGLARWRLIDQTAGQLCIRKQKVDFGVCFIC